MCRIESIPVMLTPGPRRMSRIRITEDLKVSTEFIIVMCRVVGFLLAGSSLPVGSIFWGVAISIFRDTIFV